MAMRTIELEPEINDAVRTPSGPPAESGQRQAKWQDTVPKGP